MLSAAASSLTPYADETIYQPSSPSLTYSQQYLDFISKWITLDQTTTTFNITNDAFKQYASNVPCVNGHCFDGDPFELPSPLHLSLPTQSMFDTFSTPSSSSSSSPPFSDSESAERIRLPKLLPSPARNGSLLRNLFFQIISAVALLHAQGITHRDIKVFHLFHVSFIEVMIFILDICIVVFSLQISSFKLRNQGLIIHHLTFSITIEHFIGHIRLCDFGSSIDDESITLKHLYPSSPSRYENTLDYSPPEVYFSSTLPYSLHIPTSYDIWSLGIMFIEIIIGHSYVYSIDNKIRVTVIQQVNREFRKNFNRDVTSLITKCCL